MFKEELLAELFVKKDWSTFFTISFFCIALITILMIVIIMELGVGEGENKIDYKNIFKAWFYSSAIIVCASYILMSYENINYETILKSTTLQQEKKKNPERYNDFILILKESLEKDGDTTISYQRLENMIEIMERKENIKKQLEEFEKLVKEINK